MSATDLAKSPALFDPIAPLYDRTRLVPPGVLDEMYDRLFAVSGLGSSPRILDCGIGTGITVEPLLQRGARVFGLDVASEMLAILAGKARRAAWPLNLARATVLAAPFRRSSFDAAMMVNVAHLIADWRTAAREIESLVRPGGHFVIAFRRPSAAESKLTQQYLALQHRGLRRALSSASSSALRILRRRVRGRHVGPRWERALLGRATLVDQQIWKWDEEVASRDVLHWLDRRYLSYQSPLDEEHHRRIVGVLAARVERGTEREWVKGKLALSVFRFDRPVEPRGFA
ncbi:MAG: class I SAM-dependent methyltransferase [Candidatus Binatia bacterium]